MRAGAGLQGRGAPLGELGHCMAGAGGALLCRLLSGALVRGRASPSTAVPAGRAPSAPPRRLGRGWQGRRAGTTRALAPALRLPWPVAGTPRLCRLHRRAPLDSRTGAQRDPETASALRRLAPECRGWERRALQSLGFVTLGKGRSRVPQPPSSFLAPVRLNPAKGRGPSHAQRHLGSLPSFLSITTFPPLSLSLFTSISIASLRSSLRVSALRTSVYVFTPHRSPFFIYFYHISIFPSLAFLSFLYISDLSTLMYLPFLSFSVSSLFPSLSSLPPPGAVLGATREQPWNQAFASSFAEGL